MREVNDHSQAAKEYMKKSFAELRQKLDKKEKQMMEQCDERASEVITDLE